MLPSASPWFHVPWVGEAGGGIIRNLNKRTARPAPRDASYHRQSGATPAALSSLSSSLLRVRRLGAIHFSRNAPAFRNRCLCSATAFFWPMRLARRPSACTRARVLFIGFDDARQQVDQQLAFVRGKRREN